MISRDPGEVAYWKDKWKELTNVVSVMENLLSAQALQINELKAKLRGSLGRRGSVRKQYAKEAR